MVAPLETTGQCRTGTVYRAHGMRSMSWFPPQSTTPTRRSVAWSGSFLNVSPMATAAKRLETLDEGAETLRP